MASDGTPTGYSSSAKDLSSHSNPSMIQKDIYKSGETIQGDSSERLSTSGGQPNTLLRGVEVKGRDFPSGPMEGSRPNPEGFKLQSEMLKVGSENQNSNHQKYGPDSKSSANTTPNAYRSGALDGSFNKPSLAPGASNQAKPPTGQMGPNQPMRKPDGVSGVYQTQQARQSGMYQMPTSTAYSTSSYQPPPSSQTYSSAQLKGDISRTSNITYQNPTPGPQNSRGYPAGQNYSDLSHPNRTMNPVDPRPQASQPVINRPPGYQPNTQRMYPDNYQMGGNVQQIKPGFSSGQALPSAVPTSANQMYTSVTTARPAPTSPAVNSTVNMSSDSNLRMYKNGGSIDPALKTQNPSMGSVDPRTGSSSATLIADSNKPTDSVPKKSEHEIEKAPEDTAAGKTSTDKSANEADKEGTKKETKNDKESGIVFSNVKFFEERDTCKVPLTPMKSSSKKATEAPSRPKTIVPANVVKGESYGSEDYESGVDETPLLLSNLRSISVDRTLDYYCRRGRRSEKSKRERSRSARTHYDIHRSNNSYPSTPVKCLPSFGHTGWKTSRASSRSQRNILEYSPDEELLYFFHLARSRYPGFFDRNHDLSRIEDASARKENVPTANGEVRPTKRTPARLPATTKRSSSACSPTKAPMRSPSLPKSLPKTPDSPAPPAPLIKKVPMNKIQVGAAPSPNLKAARSKIGSLANTTHKPGGGNIKIESHKVDFSKTQPRIAAKNDTYAPGGGDKKIQQVKLQWSAKSKIGSLENATHKPGGGDKKIESVKLDFKDRAKPKVGSKDNVKHVPGGGAVKIESQKLEFKAQSKVGSLDNVKHKPGGGDVKIFDDKTYLKQISCGSSEGRASGTQSYCDLSIVSEVHSISAPGTPHHGTNIKIRKSTTLGRTRPGISKTTEVTVMSRSPSIERKNLVKSPSTHEVKLTYAKVTSPGPRKPITENLGPVEVVKVPVDEDSAILRTGIENRDESPIEVKSLISSFEQQISNNKGLMFHNDAKAYPKTRPEHSQDLKTANRVNEELNQKFNSVKEELDRVTQEKSIKSEENTTKNTQLEDSNSGDAPMSKFLKNEMITHEKIGEMWTEVHNISPDKPKVEESSPPPPPPTPSVTQKLGFPQQQSAMPSQQQIPAIRPHIAGTVPTQQSPLGQRMPMPVLQQQLQQHQFQTQQQSNQQPHTQQQSLQQLQAQQHPHSQQQQFFGPQAMQRPPQMQPPQMNQRPQMMQNPQYARSPLMSPQGPRQPFPQEPSSGFGTGTAHYQGKPSMITHKGFQGMTGNPPDMNPPTQAAAQLPTYSTNRQ